jgi:hypothetical protein
MYIQVHQTKCEIVEYNFGVLLAVSDDIDKSVMDFGEGELAELFEFEFELLLEELAGEVDSDGLVISLEDEQADWERIDVFGELDELLLFMLEGDVPLWGEVVVSDELLHEGFEVLGGSLEVHLEGSCI